jgi:hypothetical protein
MLRGTTVLLGTFTLAAAAVPVAAQAQARPRQGAVGAAPAPARPRPRQGGIPAAPVASAVRRPTSGVRIAGIAPAPTTVFQPTPIPTTGLFTNIVPATAPQAFAPRPATFFFLPAVVLSDGRVFADFNGNYEEVLRQCPLVPGTNSFGFVAPACWMVDAYGRYSVMQRR